MKVPKPVGKDVTAIDTLKSGLSPSQKGIQSQDKIYAYNTRHL